jgi:hypothetical protein
LWNCDQSVEAEKLVERILRHAQDDQMEWLEVLLLAFHQHNHLTLRLSKGALAP